MIVWVVMAMQIAQTGGIPKLVAALTKDAAAFSRCASGVYTQETLTHRALNDNGKWKEFRVLSSYSFASPREKSSAVREIRLIQSVNGHTAKRADSLDLIAMSVSSGSDQDRRKMIEQLEKQGIKGVATDLGQLLLLFSEGSVGNYEFSFQGGRSIDTDPLVAFSFRQIDGPESMTVFRGGEVVKPKLAGEVWLRESDMRLVRVSLNSMVPATDKQPNSLQEMTVDYAWAETQGCLLPTLAEHREYHDGTMLVENKYQYKAYQPFHVNKR